MLKTEKGTVTLENSTLRMTVDCEHGKISEMSNRHAGKPSNQDRDLFLLEAYGHEYRASDFRFEELTKAEDATQELVSLLYSLDEEKIRIKIHLINGKDSLTYLMQVQDKYKFGVQTDIFVKIPLLSYLESGAAAPEKKYYPYNSVPDKRGSNVLKPVAESFYSPDILLPLVVCGDSGIGISAFFPYQSDLNDGFATQNINAKLTKIENEKQLKELRLQINPDPTFNDTLEICFTGITKGWSEAFASYREYWRHKYDFYDYKRKDIAWIRDCAVHSFEFLYGAQSFDMEKGEIDVDRIIERGKKFGGFDTVTLWNNYPRAGIDSRNQFDLYDDVPGGRETYRRAIRKLQHNGIRVFISYVPWDLKRDETTNDTKDSFFRLLDDLKPDGVFLHNQAINWNRTSGARKQLTSQYSKKLREEYPGVVMMSQGHPIKKQHIETITSSWDELWKSRMDNPMPEADVLRYIMPQHIAPVCARAMRRKGKDGLINRAVFNATPIVVIEDDYGRETPYSENQCRRIAAWKKTFQKYRAIYGCENPMPLVPVSADDVYCNVFTDEAGGGTIYSVYSDSEIDCSVTIPLLKEGTEAEQIFGNKTNFDISENNLKVTVHPGEVVHILIGG